MMIESGTLLSDSVPYVEGTEPVPFAFRTSRGIFIGFNFSDEHLRAGRTISVVLDMFQRFVYTRTNAVQVITTGQKGKIEEPVTSSPYREYSPNFLPTDKDGKYIPKEPRDTTPAYIHHLSAGVFRLYDKKYAPIQATYHGGEDYVNSAGELTQRERGTLQYDRTGNPLYLLRRKVARDNRHFARHSEFFLAKDLEGRNVFLTDIRSDSPFQYEYVNGRSCNFDIKPVPIVGHFPEEWEHTTDFSEAQYNYDLCVLPEGADGECYVKGEEMCFERKIAFVKVPVYTPLGEIVEDAWQWAGYTYYEAVPQEEYYEPLRGQGHTEGFYFKSLPDTIEVKTIDQVEEPEVTEYTRLKLVPGTGIPELHNEERVCRLCEYAPSRGVFYKFDEDGIRYPIIVTPDTSEGYGIATATVHTAYNEITHQCETIVEHRKHRIVRENTELLLTLEDDCWRQCGKIDGTIPPDLGDPRAVEKRSIFVERKADVRGNVPGMISLSSGTYFNLVSGEVVRI